MMQKYSYNTKNTKNKKGHTPFDAALIHLSSRPRTVADVKTRLLNYGFCDDEIDIAIERLLDLNILNDASYAKEFVETRCNTKPISKSKLYSQLQAHGIEKETIKEALDNISEEQELNCAIQLAKKFLPRYENYQSPEKENRVIKRLISRGFTYDTAREALLEAIK